MVKDRAHTLRLKSDKVVRLLLRTLPLFPGPEIYDLLRDVQRSRTKLGEKVRHAASALEDASLLVAELENELKSRMEKVEVLKTKYEHYQQLATVEEEKAKALIDELQSALGSDRRKERWIALVSNLAAGFIVFVIGVWLSSWVKSKLGIGG